MIVLLGVVVLTVTAVALSYFVYQKSDGEGIGATQVQGDLSQDTASIPYTFSYPKSEVSLKVTQVPAWGLAVQKEKGSAITQKINPQGILYDRLTLQHQSEILAFYTQSYGVSITIENDQGMSPEHREAVFEEIIGTFALKE